MTDLVWREPTKTENENHSGDIPLKYVFVPGTTVMDATYNTEKEYGDLFVGIDTEGCLVFEYFLPAYEPWNESTVIFYIECGSVESAKRVAELVWMDIDNTTLQRWADLGFTRDEV